jgi:hypothetical protein
MGVRVEQGEAGARTAALTFDDTGDAELDRIANKVLRRVRLASKARLIAIAVAVRHRSLAAERVKRLASGVPTFILEEHRGRGDLRHDVDADATAAEKVATILTRRNGLALCLAQEVRGPSGGDHIARAVSFRASSSLPRSGAVGPSIVAARAARALQRIVPVADAEEVNGLHATATKLTMVDAGVMLLCAENAIHRLTRFGHNRTRSWIIRENRDVVTIGIPAKAELGRRWGAMRTDRT